MTKKIAVLRANALGDYIFVIPALQALRESFPEAEIVYLGRAWHKEYLSGRPGPVDRVIVVPPYPGISECEGFNPDRDELDTFFAEMQGEEFDIAFQFHGGGRNSNPFILRLGAKLTVGLKTPDAIGLDISVPYIYYFSEILRYLEVVAQVGAKTTAIEPTVAVTAQDIEEADRIANPVPGKSIAVIHPGASDMRRRWPPKNFALIADFLIEQGFEVYITGVTFETEAVNSVIAHAQNKTQIKNLCNILPLKGMTGLLAKADLLVSNDTGPLHLARALKTPTVGIYWCGNIITGLPMTTGKHWSLPSFAINCPLCGLPATKFDKNNQGACKHQASFVADVEAEDVKVAVQELINLKIKKGKSIHSHQEQEV